MSPRFEPQAFWQSLLRSEEELRTRPTTKCVEDSWICGCGVVLEITLPRGVARRTFSQVRPKRSRPSAWLPFSPKLREETEEDKREAQLPAPVYSDNLNRGRCGMETEGGAFGAWAKAG